MLSLTKALFATLINLKFEKLQMATRLVAG